MGVLVAVFIIYGLLAAYYFIFKYLPTLLLYVLLAPVALVAPFVIAHRQMAKGNRLVGYLLYILFGFLYVLLIALAVL